MKSYNDIKSKVLCCNGSYGIIAKVPTALYPIKLILKQTLKVTMSNPKANDMQHYLTRLKSISDELEQYNNEELYNSQVNTMLQDLNDLGSVLNLTAEEYDDYKQVCEMVTMSKCSQCTRQKDRFQLYMIDSF